MSAAARHTAETRFCTDLIIPQYEAYYRDERFAQVRDASGAPLGRFGILVAPDGAATLLDPAALSITPLDTWRSPRS